MIEYTLGIDVGTTGTKTVALSPSGKLLCGAYKGYETATAVGGIAEQNAADWWDAVVYTVRECTKTLDGTCVAISLSTQGSTMLCADENTEPLAPAITWLDMRSEKECGILDAALGEHGIYERTGWGTDSGCDAAKLLWLKRNEPELFSKTKKFLSTVEYINFKLVGKPYIDPTNASIRELYNIKTRRWDEDILAVIGLSEDRLPEVVPSGEYIGTLSGESARLLGLDEGVKVYCGAHDQYCASIGCGAVNVGDMMLSTGTSWVLLGISDKLSFTSSRITPGIHPIKGLYGSLASLGAVGNAVKWVRDTFGISDYGLFDSEAEKRLQTSRDVIFIPAFSGAGFPVKRPELSGTLTGLRLGNDKFDIARAVMEGVAFQVRHALEKYTAEGIEISKLKIMGGASRSDIWCNIVSHVTGCELMRMENAEACAVGAATLAAVSSGMASDYSVGARRQVLTPSDPELTEHYNIKYKKYLSILEAMKNG